MPPELLLHLLILWTFAATSKALNCLVGEPACLNGGRCVSRQGNGTGACVCQPGYVGERCQHEDPCRAAPCLHGATCRPVLAPAAAITLAGQTRTLARGGVGYTCKCPLGFAGPRCASQLDSACYPNPCLNGGHCELLTLSSFRCHCLIGWAGHHCEHPQPCASNPCANGGVCSANGDRGHFTCSCRHGYMGPRCHSDLDECSEALSRSTESSLCHNGGTCINTPGSFACHCRAGFAGARCQALLRPCSPSPCHNGGTCQQLEDSSYACACLPGFQGQRCERNIDDCGDNACQNDATCVDGVNTYNCQCPPEWTGQFCTEDVDECSLQPNACLNGGTCHNTQGAFACVCVNGWTGKDCSENIDDCATAACYNGATCHDRVATFYCECPVGKTGLLCHLDDACVSDPCHEGSLCDTNPITGRAICTCPPGYTGWACKDDVNECYIGGNPCEHGGRCVNTIGTFRCDCLPGYTGARCEIDINECRSTPCLNDATCLDQIGEFTCICMPGFVGSLCEINVDECQSNPCLNGGECHDRPNGYHCDCRSGFTGSMCQIDIDECASTPCYNGAKCVDLPNMFECQCPEGFSGPLCEIDVNDCEPDPCHHGRCIDGVGMYSCECRPGYAGTRCETQINECASAPCRHGGKCVDLVNGYQCVCRPGTGGTNCEVNYNDCNSNPCTYGTCRDGINSYQCVCEPGYTGPMCNLNIDECASAPCHNGGTCMDEVDGFLCLCPDGFQGDVCLAERDECASNPCLHGFCEDNINGYRCICELGWEGRDCDVDRDDCAYSPCRHGGSCYDQLNDYTCVCRNGFTGSSCEININECQSNPCLNEGQCVDMLAGYVCLCRPPYTGQHCEIKLAPCAVAPCRNGALCRETPDFMDFMCMCSEGWQGRLCDIDVNECGPDPCQNGGTCVNTHGDYICVCLLGYDGRHCEVNVDDCASAPCQNGGTCRDGVNTVRCKCRPGFAGPLCQTEVDECASSPCHHGANCTDYVASYTCSCPPGFNGIHCENNIPDCTESSCFNGGMCVDGINSYRCVCRPGYSGSNCQHEVDECHASPCRNGGTCRDGLGSFHCVCLHGYTGSTCQSLLDWCATSPCKNDGTCSQSGTAFRCECASGWTGIYCDVPNVSCDVAAHRFGVMVSGLCHHSGSCIDVGNSHRCQCQAGFRGSYCADELDECASSPCHNGGTCTDYLGGYSCECVAGYQGLNCEQEINECQSQPCEHGGTCIDLVNRYICSCPPGTEGVRCEINIDDCFPSVDPATLEPRCFNGGSCIDRVGGFLCSCPPGFVGERCEGDVNECLSNPCYAPGALDCLQLVNDYQCRCRPGYSGRHCETTIDICEGQPCKNGGSCTVSLTSPSGFTCKCQPGYSGLCCHESSNKCGNLTCRNAGVCVQTAGAGAHCVCPSSHTSTECEVPTEAPCLSRMCYNGGICESQDDPPYFHCQCPANFNGLHCHILDVNFTGGIGENIAPPPAVQTKEKCPQLECLKKAGDGRCDHHCNVHACGWDGGDCSLNFDDPWRNCSRALRCWLYFGNGHCDKQCSSASCLYDGFDCQESRGRTCNPIYDLYCRHHFGNGHCDQGCNSEECGWDGGDCAPKGPALHDQHSFVLIVLIPPEELLNDSVNFLRQLSFVLHTGVRFKRDEHGREMIYPYYGGDKSGRTLFAPSLNWRQRREVRREVLGSIVHLELDPRLCSRPGECLSSSASAAAFLAAQAVQGSLDFPYPLQHVGINMDKPPVPGGDFNPLYLVVVGVGGVVMLLVAMGVITRGKRQQQQHGTLWFPEGFALAQDAADKKRRDPLGQDALGLRHLKIGAGLMDDNQNEAWLDGPHCKRMKIEEQVMLPGQSPAHSGDEGPVDPRPWTQQHFDAADVRLPLALTPQGDADGDGMDVDVRGPDGFTPLMLASLRGGGLDTSAEEEEGQFEVTDEVAGSASVITDLIFQGASLHAQTDRTGETALHLAARYARADAAKRLLDSGADANVADNTGRTPLHAAVAADAQGVFQILIRNRATDLDARMHDGTTALVLAARLAVEGMVEELVASHADINAVDDLGKSALHWAAAVNNVEAMMVLLKHGANKDMQDNKEETPLFLAAREGSLEAVRILLEHGANRDITDHMDRLPRDAARDRHHHDILHLLDQLGPGQGCAASVAPQTTLVMSPPHCTSTVTTFLPGGVTASPASGVAANVMIGQRPLLVPQGKKGRRANSQRGTLGGKDGRGKKGKGTKPSALATLDAGGLVPSPAESLDSPCGNYTSDSLSPPLLSPPGLLHTSPSLRHLHSTSPLYESGAPPRLSHLPLQCDATAPPRHDWIVPTHITMGHYAHGNAAQTGTVQRMLSLPHGITYQRQHSNASAVFCGRLLQDTSGLQYTQTGINTQVMPVSVPMYPTPPSQHSYASVAGSCRGAGSMAAMQPALGGSSSPHEATPAISFPDIAYLTPSPDSPEAWSSSSPHSASDWSEGVSSPPTDQLAMTATIMT